MAVPSACATTQAKPRDGLFAAPSFLAEGGRLAIGTDSHVGVDPFAELRLLEYGQRLTRGRRGVLSIDGRSVAATLFDRVAAGGAQAADQPTSRISVGARADLIVLDDNHPDLAGRHGDALLDALVFAPTPPPPLIPHVHLAPPPRLPPP